jgi:hypothetical protein
VKEMKTKIIKILFRSVIIITLMGSIYSTYQLQLYQNNFQFVGNNVSQTGSVEKKIKKNENFFEKKLVVKLIIENIISAIII